MYSGCTVDVLEAYVYLTNEVSCTLAVKLKECVYSVLVYVHFCYYTGYSITCIILCVSIFFAALSVCV